MSACNCRAICSGKLRIGLVKELSLAILGILVIASVICKVYLYKGTPLPPAEIAGQACRLFVGTVTFEPIPKVAVAGFPTMPLRLTEGLLDSEFRRGQGAKSAEPNLMRRRTSYSRGKRGPPQTCAERFRIGF